MQSAIVNKFKNFRDHVFAAFSFRADATMDLIDALSGNRDATSVVQLSLNPIFRRRYGSIRDVITNFARDPKQQMNIEACLIKTCSLITKTQPYRLVVLDCTPAPRKYSKTVEDRGVIHAPNPIPDNKPITIGHQYSVMGFLPEQNLENEHIPWMLPLSTRRVSTNTNGIAVGIEQLNTVLPFFRNDLTVALGDTVYSNPKFIKKIQEQANTVLIARLRGDRIINRKAIPKQRKRTNRRERGHELWYGDEFKFKDESTWGEADEVVSSCFKTRKNKSFKIHIMGWHDMLMRQKNGILLNQYPFRVIRITITDEDNSLVYKRPMWLMVSGKRCRDLNLIQIWQAYERRYDIEHFFKFGKSRLLILKTAIKM